MGSDALSQLTEQLRTDPPEAVGALSEAQLTHLSSALQAARRRQSEALQAAAAQAFDRIPRLLRGPVRKIVG